MKVVIAFSVLIAVATALPQQSTTADLIIQGVSQKDNRIVTGSIIKAIEEAKEAIVDAGLDPYSREKIDFDYALPVPVLFNTQIAVEEILITGLSNIVVHSINFSIFTNRLTFDIRLPLIEFALGKATLDATLFGSSTESYASGRVAIVGIRVAGNIRINIGIISGISIRSLAMDFSLSGIQSDVTVISHGKNFSNIINRFLGGTVPKTLDEYSSQINELIEIIALQVIEANL